MTPVSLPRGSWPKSARIRKRREYQRVQEAGQRLVLSTHILVLVARAPSPAGTRLGVTASRKIGGAVVRNRAKRLVREAFRASRELFPDDVDLVVIVRRAPAEQRLSEIVQEWRSASQALKSRVERARRARDASKSHAARGA